MLGHFPNSHFLQAGFCLPSAPEVTSIALSRKLTIFSQRSSGLACLLLEPLCSPESRISMLLPHNHSVFTGFSFFFFFFWSSLPPSPNGNPLQYSCLENPMDRGAWRAIVHGVAKSRTWLSDFTFFPPPPMPCHWPFWRLFRTLCRSPRFLGRGPPPAAPSGCWWHSCSLLWWASKSCTHPMPGPWLGRRVGGKHHCPHPHIPPLLLPLLSGFSSLFSNSWCFLEFQTQSSSHLLHVLLGKSVIQLWAITISLLCKNLWPHLCPPSTLSSTPPWLAARLHSDVAVAFQPSVFRIPSFLLLSPF